MRSPASLVVLGHLFFAGIAGADDSVAKFDAQIKPEHRRHWAFQPVRAVRVPSVKDSAWAKNPIDRFVLARLEVRGWKPSPTTPSPALLRRVYLDLTGLPPTPEEQDA